MKTAVKDKIDTLGDPIRVLLFMGDWPDRVTNVYHAPPLSGIGFFQAFKRPSYFLSLSDGATYDTSGSNDGKSSTTSEFYTRASNTFATDPPRWPGIHPYQWVDAPEQTFSPYYKPYAQNGALVSFCIPLGNNADFPDAVAVAKARIYDTLIAEHNGYTDFGKVIARGGSSTNISSNCIYAEMVHEDIPRSDFHYVLNTEATNSRFYTAPGSNNDPSGYASKVPGMTGFTTPTNVGLIDMGSSAYYTFNENCAVEQPGDIGYREGAIVVAGQSYGANPSPYAIIDWFDTAPNFASVTDDPFGLIA